MKKSVLALSLLATSTVVLAAGPGTWGYEGKTGPDNWGNLSQLILTWLELTRTLPHVSVNETELNFLLHSYY